MPRTEKHYTALVQISSTEHNEGTGRGDDRTVDREVFKVVVRSATIEGLQEKIVRTAALISED